MTLFEQGILVFPNDFPDTLSYKNYALREFEEGRDRFFRRPPSKRLNFQKLGIHYPFHSPWGELLFGRDETKPNSFKTVEDLFSSKTYTVARYNHQLEEIVVLSGLSNQTYQGSQNYEWVPKKQQTPTIPEYLASYLVPVTLRMTSKGRPERFAIIYQPTDQDYIDWYKSPETWNLLPTSLFNPKVKKK